MAKEIPVTVCNSRRPNTPGTAIVRHAPPSRAAIKADCFQTGDYGHQHRFGSNADGARLFGALVRDV